MTDDKGLTLAEFKTIMETIEDQTYSKWVLCLPIEVEAHYLKHPPSEEEMEMLIRKYGAMRVSGRGIEEWRFPDRLWHMLKQTEEFKNLQTV